jgi:hypothetical protein
MCLIEGESQILYHLEAIDIGNDEYVFWDANGDGVSIAVSVSTFKSRLDVGSCPAAFPIREAFVLYAKSLGLPETVAEGTPTEAWRRIRAELAVRPKKRGPLSKLFSV